MSNEQGYNGWSNYETWAAALWMDNEEGAQAYWREQAEECMQDAIDADESDIRAAATSALEDRIKAEHEDAMPELQGVYADLLGAALGAIDYREIARNLLSAIEIFAAGWNMPGYMPDNPPAVFMGADDARAYIADQIEQVWSDMDEESRDESASYRDEDLLERLKAGSGEYGLTVGAHHYFVNKL